jgi:hypothetical protein
VDNVIHPKAKVELDELAAAPEVVPVMEPVTDMVHQTGATAPNISPTDFWDVACDFAVDDGGLSEEERLAVARSCRFNMNHQRS